MAFCKFCGNEIPEGGTCNCQGAQNNAAPQQDNNAAPVGGDQVNNGGFDNTVEKAKNNLPLIIGGIVGLIVLILVLVFVAGHTGAKGAANKYAKAMTKKNGGKTIYSLTLPDDYIKELKDDDKWDDMIDDYKDTMSDRLDEYKIKIKDVKKGKKLKKSALNGAEAYFEKMYDADVTVKKGYEFTIKAQTKDKEDGDKDTNKTKICVVKVKGEGWKVILTSKDNLEDYDD
ncbi:MAG: hypothetical protein NC485_02130 [Ruminococcus flavefaciens]|nr:hypothetical protein [Ruminococcus flavefaciens]MCM1059965.1 hypothetical protein [Eubacterium sp.]